MSLRSDLFLHIIWTNAGEESLVSSKERIELVHLETESISPDHTRRKVDVQETDYVVTALGMAEDETRSYFIETR